LHRRLAVLFAAGSLAAVAAPVAQAPASNGPVIAHAACTQATIGGQSKCIARGQYCARLHARDYRRYGLSCTKRDANGRYHLQ
jgi:hypothetical protein